MLLGMDANNAELHTKRWELLWGVQKSQRYHSCRMAFFDRCDKLNSVIGLLSGSAVIASLGQYAPQWMAIAGAVTVTITTSINLVAGTAQMARIHSDLRRIATYAAAFLNLSPTSLSTQTQRKNKFLPGLHSVWR
ncbi:hypothetical protein LOD59_10885 [Xylella fastidiosa subsp. multiplex]|uniref:hypothetical protein n=1 Tax=Xylella fastidiosa TaxID=2371 RepID=UPI002362444B|nr:hypothetical protein [Xylella fastidiosa]MDD0928117.1 hypothetical protein [Xylella fastidiosa subsp. multiplex]